MPTRVTFCKHFSSRNNSWFLVRHIPVTHLLLLATAAALTLSASSAAMQHVTPLQNEQNASTSSVPDKPFPNNLWLSSDGHMSEVMAADSQFFEGLQTIQNFVVFVENAITDILKQKHSSFEHPLLPCNSDGKGFSRQMWIWFETPTLPTLRRKCITEFQGTKAFHSQSAHAKGTFTVPQLLNAIQLQTEALHRNRKEIVRDLVPTWSNADVRQYFVQDERSLTCRVYQVAGLRKGDNWHIINAVTNQPVDLNVPLYQRQTVSELIHAHQNGSLSSLRFAAKNINSESGEEDTDKKQKMVWNATTTINSGYGAKSLSMFKSMFFANAPSLLSAKDNSDLWIQQAQDALTPSSLAILILPLTLNLIPIAVIAQVRTTVLYIYLVISDILTVIPLAIKGWELMHIADQTFQDSAIRITSADDGSRAPSAVMQLWVTECRPGRYVYISGIIFITIASVFLVFGVTLEFVAKALVSKRKLMRSMASSEHEPPLTKLIFAKPQQNLTIGTAGIRSIRKKSFWPQLFPNSFTPPLSSVDSDYDNHTQ